MILLVVIFVGFGLGISFILVFIVFGVINDFCGLVWDKNEIC